MKDKIFLRTTFRNTPGIYKGIKYGKTERALSKKLMITFE